MTTDLALLARKAISCLLPYLVVGESQLGEQARSGVTGRLWEWLASALADPALLEQFARQPEPTAPRVEALLRQKLSQDAALARPLAELLAEQAATEPGAGAQIIGRVDVRGAKARGARGVKITGVRLQIGPPPGKEE